MKAKIKATGEIKELSLAVFSGTQVISYRDSNGIYYNTQEVEIIPDQPEAPIIDWEQRRYEIAKAAMQGMLAHSTRYHCRPEDSNLSWKQGMIKESLELADELINQLKNTPVK